MKKKTKRMGDVWWIGSIWKNKSEKSLCSDRQNISETSMADQFDFALLSRMFFVDARPFVWLINNFSQNILRKSCPDVSRTWNVSIFLWQMIFRNIWIQGTTATFCWGPRNASSSLLSLRLFFWGLGKTARSIFHFFLLRRRGKIFLWLMNWSRNNFFLFACSREKSERK